MSEQAIDEAGKRLGYKRIPINEDSLPTVAIPVTYLPSESDWFEIRGDSVLLHAIPPQVSVEIKFDADKQDWVPIIPNHLVRYDYTRFRLKLIHLSSVAASKSYGISPD